MPYDKASFMPVFCAFGAASSMKQKNKQMLNPAAKINQASFIIEAWGLQ